MNRIKLYISLPITGYDIIERKATAEKEAREIKETILNVGLAEDVGIITPFTVNTDLAKPYEELMRKDIAALSTCDYIVLLDGWGKSKGCLEEIAVAKELKIKILGCSRK